MKALTLTSRKNGTAYLHTWRTGNIYYEKNREVILNGWTNLIHQKHCDHIGLDGVRILDTAKNIPAADQVFDAVYSCHVIEHLTREDVSHYLKELYRVMKPSAVLRISTPDLARDTAEYVRCVHRCLEEPGLESERHYELAVCALIDQFVRKNSGGHLLEYFQRDQIDHKHALARYGDVYREFLKEQVPEVQTKRRYSAKQALEQKNLAWLKDKLKIRALRLLRGHSAAVIGETELWKWDQYSLSKVFQEAGFKNVKLQAYNTSDIPDWDTEQLDTSFDGETPIERSLYLEARKPNA